MQNPYLKIYHSTFSNSKMHITKQYCENLAINLGHVHNALGQMVKDIFYVMGRFISNQQLMNNKDQTKKVVNKPTQKKFEQINKIKQDNNIKPNYQNDYSPQKMQVEFDTYTGSRNNNNKQDNKSNQIDLHSYVFQSVKKQNLPLNQNKNKSYLQFSNLSSQHNQNSDDDHQSNLSHTSHTQTAQIVRSQSIQSNFQQFNNDGYFNCYQSQKKQKSNSSYHLNVKPPQQIPSDKKPPKNVFFDIFDSQTPSYPQQQQEETPHSNTFRPPSKNQQKYYPQSQGNSNTQTFVNSKQKTFYSYQNNKNNTSNQINMQNPFSKRNNNLLEDTRWLNNSPSRKMFDVQQIDQIQTSEKKPNLNKFPSKKKQQNIRKPDSDQQYVPRRQEQGRKKSDRLGMTGSSCPDCKAFYKAVGEDSKNMKNLCECTSRHKTTTNKGFINNQKVPLFSQQFDRDLGKFSKG